MATGCLAEQFPLPALLSAALDAEDAAFEDYESREMCWRLTRSLQAQAVNGGASPLTLEGHAEDVEFARVELAASRARLDEAIRGRVAVWRQMRAANLNDQAAE